MLPEGLPMIRPRRDRVPVARVVVMVRLPDDSKLVHATTVVDVETFERLGHPGPDWYVVGGCVRERWLIDPERNPAAIFGALMMRGFADRTAARQALEAFAKIAGCRWPRYLLAGARYALGEAHPEADHK